MTARKKGAPPAPDAASFEDGVAALESLVAELESGELPLEKALESFEQGVRLVRELNQRLSDAEAKIEILSRGADGELELTPHVPAAPTPDDDDGGA